MASSRLQQVIGVVTGGASGLGRASVKRLVRNGARVVIADLSSSDGEVVEKDLGENCAFVPTDVSVEMEYGYRALRTFLLNNHKMIFTK